MDQMMIYCSHPSADDEASIEACADYSPSQHGVVQYCNEFDHNFQNEVERDLLKQIDNYRAQIKRQEEEINSYRQHIEAIEEEYTKLSNHLSAAEKNIRQHEKQMCNYQETISSLKNELDSFYNMESSFTTEANSPSSDVSLSFSNDSNLKIYDESDKSKDDGNESSVQEKLLLLETYQKICLENLDLKRRNEFLQAEVRRLQKDNDDLHDMLANYRPKAHEFVNSTPIKHLNFMSYKALNVDNNSFSIDEDFDGENLFFGKSFKTVSNQAPPPPPPFAGGENLGMFFPNGGTNLTVVKEISSIDNQEIPSCIVNNEFSSDKITTAPITKPNQKLLCSDTFTNAGENFEPFPSNAGASLTEVKEVSSIEDQEIPSCIVGEEPSSDKMTTAPITTTTPIESDTLEPTTTNTTTTTNKMAKTFTTNTNPKVSYFVTFILMFLIWISLKVSCPNLQTRLVPFYSIQEIVIDILSQFCL